MRDGVTSMGGTLGLLRWHLGNCQRDTLGLPGWRCVCGGWHLGVFRDVTLGPKVTSMGGTLERYTVAVSPDWAEKIGERFVDLRRERRVVVAGAAALAGPAPSFDADQPSGPDSDRQMAFQ